MSNLSSWNFPKTLTRPKTMWIKLGPSSIKHNQTESNINQTWNHEGQSMPLGSLPGAGWSRGNLGALACLPMLSLGEPPHQAAVDVALLSVALLRHFGSLERPGKNESERERSAPSKNRVEEAPRLVLGWRVFPLFFF